MIREAFEKQLEHPAITEEQLVQLKGRPFTGEYDDQGEKMLSQFKVGEKYLTCIIQEGICQRSVATSDTYLDKICENHEFIELKQELLPLVKRKKK